MMPLSVHISRVRGEKTVIVTYNLKNNFNDPVAYELIQALPEGISVNCNEGTLSSESLTFYRTLNPGASAFFQWKTEYSGSDDFVLPAATLKFFHPYRAVNVEIDITPDPLDAEENSVMLFGLEGSRDWFIDQTVSNTFSVSNGYSEDKTIAIHAVLTDSQGTQAAWDFSETATADQQSDFSLTFDLTGKSLVEGEAGLTITVTPENGTALTAVSGIPITIRRDSDNDGLPDDWETENGLDTTVDDTAADKDNDGLTNAEEYENGTKANVADTDGDGLTDGQEVNTHTTNPLLADTDGGGENDGSEISAARDPKKHQDDSLNFTIHLPPDLTFGDYVFVSWTNANPFAADITYRISIGTGEGIDDIIAWTDKGELTTFALDTTLLPDDQGCYVNVELLQDGVSQLVKSKSLTAWRDHLVDAIQCLQVAAGIESPTGIYSKTDISGDGKIGLEEAVDAFHKSAFENSTVFTNSLGMTFRLIPAGTFIMGSPTDELGRFGGESQHQVTLTKNFYIMTTEVTQAQWEAVMGGISVNCSDCAVGNVSWHDTQAFITAFNQWGEGTYRLPTEAEWEYAARAGSTTAFANGDITETGCEIDVNLDRIGWFCGNTGSYSMHLVAQKLSNAWGVYDMHGNALEWCADWLGVYEGPVIDPVGPISGEYRILRGGSYSHDVPACRSACRLVLTPDQKGFNVGFRLAFTPDQ